MAIEVLLDGKKPAELAVKTFDNGTATVNTEICEALGIKYDELRHSSHFVQRFSQSKQLKNSNV